MLVMFGIDYKTSSLDIRDKLSYTKFDIEVFIRKVLNAKICKEIVVLSTCNRIEVYCDTNDVNLVINSFLEYKNICPYSSLIPKQNMYVYYLEDMVRHLFSVTSGLSSMVLGESEIVAQIKNAVIISTNLKSIGFKLRSIFEMALSVSKEVRANTSLNHVSISLGKAIKSIIEREYNDINHGNLLILGAGNMVRHIAPYLTELKFKNKFLINRDKIKGNDAAKICNAEYKTFDELQDVIDKSQVILVAISSNEWILTPKLFTNNKDVIIIDISMPLVSDINLKQELRLFTIDDVRDLVDVGITKRKEAANDAYSIIDEKINEYKMWQKKRDLSPLIKELRLSADNIRQEVFDEFVNLEMNDDLKNIIHDFSVKLMNRFMHQPTVNLCSFNEDNYEHFVDLVAVLFGLNKKVE
jgi:glutamyl-tRNA reductase